MNTEAERQWESEIDEMFRQNPKKAQYMVEHHWKEYLEYFLQYFSLRAEKGRNINVLDAGCGAGLVCRELARRGFEVCGIDFSLQAIAFAKKENSRIDFRQSSIYTLPFADETFDAVICLGVFQTVTDSEKALTELVRVLKKGGVLAIRTLNSLSLSFPKAKKNNPLFSFYNPFALKRALKRHRLEEISLKGIYFFPESLGFLNRTVLKTGLYAVGNFLFFPVFVLFSHSFYIEAEKQ